MGDVVLVKQMFAALLVDGVEQGRKRQSCRVSWFKSAGLSDINIVCDRELRFEIERDGTAQIAYFEQPSGGRASIVLGADGNGYAIRGETVFVLATAGI